MIHKSYESIINANLEGSTIDSGGRFNKKLCNLKVHLIYIIFWRSGYIIKNPSYSVMQCRNFSKEIINFAFIHIHLPPPPLDLTISMTSSQYFQRQKNYLKIMENFVIRYIETRKVMIHRTSSSYISIINLH